MGKKKYCTTMNEMIQKYSHETPINESSENWCTLDELLKMGQNIINSYQKRINENNIHK
jgi:hypothetical protein